MSTITSSTQKNRDRTFKASRLCKRREKERKKESKEAITVWTAFPSLLFYTSTYDIVYSYNFLLPFTPPSPESRNTGGKHGFEQRTSQRSAMSYRKIVAPLRHRLTDGRPAFFQGKNGEGWPRRTEGRTWRKPRGWGSYTCRNTPTTSTGRDAGNTRRGPRGRHPPRRPPPTPRPTGPTPLAPRFIIPCESISPLRFFQPVPVIELIDRESTLRRKLSHQRQFQIYSDK